MSESVENQSPEHVVVRRKRSGQSPQCVAAGRADAARARSTNSSASSTFWGRANCSAGCWPPIGSGSVIFYGPPGTGKTTLAHLLATASRSVFRQAQRRGQRREGIARDARRSPRPACRPPAPKTLLFVDEIHRFNKAQQDVLLPDVEEGVVVLVGATTQNPFFALNSALVSRSRVFQFEPLSTDDIKHGAARGAGRRASADWAGSKSRSTTTRSIFWPK